MKKLFRIFVILCAAALMFSGCSSPTGGDGGKDGVSFTESDTSLTLAQGTFELTDGT